MTTRDDAHRVSEFIPEDYEYVFGYTLQGTEPWDQYNSGLLRATISGDETFTEVRVIDVTVTGMLMAQRVTRKNPFGKLDYFKPKVGKCNCCGAYHRHGSVFRHKDGQHVMMGHICVDKLGLAIATGDRKNFYDAQKRSADIRRAIKLRRQKFSWLRDWIRENREIAELLRFNHRITKDIRARFIKNPQYGLTSRQIDLLRKLIEDEKNKPTQEKFVDIPDVDGRVDIAGEIVSVKSQDTMYGTQLKMLVIVDGPDGRFKLWGTVPSSILSGEGELKGKRVQFTARIQKSRDDSTFGFFSRPTNAKEVA